MSSSEAAAGTDISAEALHALVSQVAQSNRENPLVDMDQLQKIAKREGIEWRGRSMIDIESMPGPTGEINQLSAHPRGVVLCLGPDRAAALSQALSALAQQNRVVVVAQQGNQLAAMLAENGLQASGADAFVVADTLQDIDGVDAVMSQAPSQQLQAYRIALAERSAKLIPLICEDNAYDRLIVERHLCIDTTAAGGNASLIAAGS